MPTFITATLDHEDNRPMAKRRRHSSGHVFDLSSDRSWPRSDRCRVAAPRHSCLNLGLLRHLKRVVDLDAKVSHCTFELGVAKQQLNGAQVLGAVVNQ
jgi:hypothetical protein